MTMCFRSDRMVFLLADVMFKQLMAKYEAQQNQLMSSLSELKAEQSVVKDDTENIRHLMERFEKCTYIETLDRDTIYELIDFIWFSKRRSRERLQAEDRHTLQLCR